MPIIKRYPNRKLYDTAAKRYITLERIAELIRQGEEVQVVDHTTGEDLTAVTLTQIIFEQEKKQSGFFPRSVLAGLVRSGGDTLGTLRRSLASPLGFLRQIDEEIERRIQTLINRGELAEAEGVSLRDKLLAEGHRSPGAPWPSEQDLEQALIKRGVPTRDDFQQVIEQLEMLTAKLDSIGQHTE
jgi:polyhydroxyalkanoate synthesis repressor PhaR